MAWFIIQWSAAIVSGCIAFFVLALTLTAIIAAFTPDKEVEEPEED